MSLLPKQLPWFPSVRRAIAAANHPGLVILDAEDLEPLEMLIDSAPIEHIFLKNQLEEGIGPHRNGGFFLGLYENHELMAACWVGANVVPTITDAATGRLFGIVIKNLRRNFASIFGPASAVLGVWDELQSGRQKAFGIRTRQPLLAMDRPSAVPQNPRVRAAGITDFDIVFPASVAMFEEELGFSPMINGDRSYEERVRGLIREKHTLIGTDTGGNLNFKADLGTVTDDCAQIQGVWVPPSWRGQGIATASMSAVVDYALHISQNVSLYVNDYNAGAQRVYEKVGFDYIGDFATILF